MRAFIAACIAALIIAVCGALVLSQVNKPVETAYSTTSVRI